MLKLIIAKGIFMLSLTFLQDLGLELPGYSYSAAIQFFLMYYKTVSNDPPSHQTTAQSMIYETKLQPFKSTGSIT